MEWLTNPEIWISLLTLTALEIVLGIDNIVFISVTSSRLPASQQARARNVGLLLAMVTRILLLFSISWLTGLTAPLFEVFGQEVSGRDLILLIGGLFLIYKSNQEIYQSLEGEETHTRSRAAPTFFAVIAQIALLDIVFSLDSVITAVGLADELGVMVAAIVIAILVMLFAMNTISGFVERHPTVKMLALSFLLLIGVSLVAEGFGQEIPKGYIYFAMGFSVFVEVLNLRSRAGKTKPVKLRKGRTEEAPGASD